MNTPSFTIDNFPMPPSANGLYAFSKMYNRMIKTKAYKAYDSEVQFWIAKNQDKLSKLREFAKGLKGVFHIETTFCMQRKSVVCKDGRPKKNDTSNRIKALHDVLSEMIGVDDSYFWSGAFTKASLENGKDEYVVVKLVIREIT